MNRSLESAEPWTIGTAELDPDFERQRLFNQLAAATGLRFHPAGDGLFALRAGDDGPTLLAVPEDAAIEIAENPDQYTERLSFLQDWRQDLLTQGEANEHALELLRKNEDQGIAFGFGAPTSADEAHGAFLAAAELAEQGEDDAAAFEVFQRGLFPEFHSLTHNYGWLLDLAPGVGNIRSGEQFLEDVDNAAAAYDRGDYWAVAGHGGLALLDAAGAIPGVGNFFARPAKIAALKAIRQVPAANRLYAQRKIGNTVDAWEKRGLPEITAADVKDRKFLAETNRRLSDVREDGLAELLEDAGFRNVVRRAHAKTIGSKPLKRVYDFRIYNDIERGPFGLARPGGKAVKHLELKGSHADLSTGQKRFHDEVKRGNAVYFDPPGRKRLRLPIPINPDDEMFLRMLPDALPLDRLIERTDTMLRQSVADGHMTDSQRRRVLAGLYRRNTGFAQRTTIGELVATAFRDAGLGLRPEQEE